MEKFILQMLLFVLFVSNIAIAQNALLAGQITDENNQPAAGALIKIARGKNTITATADKDGLYYTKLLPAGAYHVRIYSDGQSYKAGVINVAASGKTKWFYDFKLTGSKAVPDIDDQDPFMMVALKKIDAKPRYDFPVLKRDKRAQYEYQDLIISNSGVWRIKTTESGGAGKIPDSTEKN